MKSYINKLHYLKYKKTDSHCRTAEGGVAELGEVGGADNQVTSGKVSRYTLAECVSYRMNTSEQALSPQGPKLNTTSKQYLI